MTHGNRRFAAAVLVLGLAGCSYVPMPDHAGASDAASRSTEPGVLDGVAILVDAGHNGGNADHPEIINEEVDAVTKDKPCDTTGTQTDDGYPEHEFNFDVASRLIEVLEADGATIIATRDSDDGVGPCLTERAALGNESAELAVSIHADGGPPDGSGFHIMEPVSIAGHTEDIVEPSHELAVAVRDAYQEALPPADYIGDDGINPRDDMGGMNLSTIPKVMVECGNMRNADDAKLLKDAGFRQQIADAIAAGIRHYQQTA